MRISDWSSDVCSSDLSGSSLRRASRILSNTSLKLTSSPVGASSRTGLSHSLVSIAMTVSCGAVFGSACASRYSTMRVGRLRSEEHTSELQSLMRISYAVFCLKKKKRKHHDATHNTNPQHKHLHLNS